MIQLENVGKKFDRGDGTFVMALEQVTASFDRGEFCIVIGNNGSGKSTLLNVIEGTIIPDAGEVVVSERGNGAKGPPDRSLVAMVHQNPAEGTAPTLTVAENITLALLAPGQAGLRRLVTKPRLDQVSTLLRDLNVEMEGREEALVRNLSGGQKQALAVCMAALRTHAVLLLDEHTAALDPDRAERIMDLTLRLWRKKNLTILMVTHDLREAVTYGTRLICLSRGRIVLDVKGEEKGRMTLADLLELFKAKSAEGFVPDSSFML